jgi:GTP-binding protein
MSARLSIKLFSNIMYLNSVRFELSAPSKQFYPKDELKELVILGRSNVGKSTFINRLTNNKSLAKTSSTPGRTRLLNFFKVNEDYRLVDAPGYGYQKGSKKSDLSFAKMMDEYLATRSNLVGALFLLDARRIPSIDDQSLLELLKVYKLPFILIATKVDKLKQAERVRLKTNLLSTLGLPLETKIIRVSSLKDDWQEEVIEKMEELLR